MRAALAVAVVLALAVASWVAFRAETEPYAPPDVPPVVAPAPETRVVPAPSSEPRAETQLAPEPEPAPLPPKPVSPRAPALVVTARVIDESLRPVAGASVDVCIDGGEPSAGVTDGAGRFTIDVAPRAAAPAPTAGRIHAFSSAGDAGVLGFRVTAEAKEPFDAGTLKLSRSGSVDVRVTRDGAPAPGVSLRLAIVPASSGGYVAASRLGGAKTAADGRARFDHVPPGSALVTASSEWGRGSHETVVHADRPAACEVALTRREIAVIVRADSDDGPSVEGARIGVTWRRGPSTFLWRQQFDPPIEVAPTDAAGCTRIAAGAEDALDLEIRADGYATKSEVRVGKQDAEVRVVLMRGVIVRWPVVLGDVLPPEDGSEVRLRPRIGTGRTEMPRPGRMEGTDLVIDDVPPGIFSAIAVAPDGSLATLHVDTRTKPTEIAFYRPRTIDVRLTEEGMPLEGAYVLAINPGNNPYGPAAVTDSAGHVVLADFDRERMVSVYLVSRPDFPMGEVLLGKADLRDGDARIAADLPRSRVVVADVSVDGVRVLPPELYVGQASGLRPAVVRDETAATLTMRVRPEKANAPVVLTTTATGYLPLRVEVPEAAGEEPVRVAFELKKGASLAGRVVPGSRPPMSIFIERETPSGWQPVPVFGNVLMPLRPDAEGGVRADGVAPGRYRLRDKESGASTPTVEVPPGGSATFAPLDLSRSGVMKVRVEGPDGKSPPGCRVLVDGDGIDQSALGYRGDPVGSFVDRDGMFTVRVPGDRTARLRAWHATLVPAPDGGVVEVVEPREGIVLRLVEGPTATIELRPALGVTGTPGSARVLLFRDEPVGVPVCTPSATVSSGTLTLGAYSPGVYTLWIDAKDFAPVVVRNVVLRAGNTELPSVEIARGSTVRVKLVLKPGEKPPGVFVSVWPLADPKYYRVLQDTGTSEFVLTGFGAGKFGMSMGRSVGSDPPVQRELELDGTSTVDVEWDLR